MSLVAERFRGLPAVLVMLLLCVATLIAYMWSYNAIFVALYDRHILRTGITTEWLNLLLTSAVPFVLQIAIVAIVVALGWVGKHRRFAWMAGFVVAAAGSFVSIWLISCEPFSCV